MAKYIAQLLSASYVACSPVFSVEAALFVRVIVTYCPDIKYGKVKVKVG